MSLRDLQCPPKMSEPLPVVFFDIKVGAASKGRIEIELRTDVVPKTCEVRTILHLVWTTCRTVGLTVGSRTFDDFVLEKRELGGQESRFTTKDQSFTV